MKLYPIFASLSQRAVLVVGAGAVAERKVATLLEAKAQVMVNADKLTPRLQQWARQRRIAHHPDPFQDRWLERVWLVVAATSDRDGNTLVATLAELRRFFVNVVDDAVLSSFHAQGLPFLSTTGERDRVANFKAHDPPARACRSHAVCVDREWLTRGPMRGHQRAG